MAERLLLALFAHAAATCLTSGSHTLNNRSYLAFAPEADRFPVLFVFHGWGESAEMQYKNDRLGDLLPASGWGVVYPDGERDVPAQWLGDGSTWRSWNGAGTTGSPGKLGATCSATADNVPCYNSCGSCKDHCWWTTCRDDVAFVASVMASLPCATRFVATGFSNGAIFLYELASRPETAPLLDAVVPVAGLPLIGFPEETLQVPLYGLWGRADHYVPPISRDKTAAATDATLSADGWYYSPAINVTGRDLASWPTPVDGEQGLACIRGSRAVGCFWDGDHAWAGAGSAAGSAAPLASRWVSHVLANLARKTDAPPAEALGVNATGMAVLAAMLVLLLLALPTRHHQREADHYVRLL
jgi:dienelactone hydrolase